MMASWQWAVAITASSLLLVLVGYVYERASESIEAKRCPAPGSMVKVESHELHLLCKGRSGPTVVIEPGAGSPSRFWWPIQDRVSGFTRVCTYDRAGYGWSPPVRVSRTIQQRAEELHTLLQKAGVPGPYILVSHSYGGLITRWFARCYPDQVAGLVLIDTPEEHVIFRRDVLKFYSSVGRALKVMGFAARFGLPRILRRWVPSLRDQLWLVRPDEYRAAADDAASLARAQAALSSTGAFGSLGDLPLVVITHGHPFPGPFAVLENGWNEGQKRLVALSSKGVLVTAENSNHMIHDDEPELVVAAIQRVHNMACLQPYSR